MWDSDSLPPWCLKPWEKGWPLSAGPWYDEAEEVEGRCEHCGCTNTTRHARQTTRNWLRQIEHEEGYLCSQCQYFSHNPPRLVPSSRPQAPPPQPVPVYGPRRPLPQIFSPEALARSRRPIAIVSFPLDKKKSARRGKAGR